jgi:hypothetical protein
MISKKQKVVETAINNVFSCFSQYRSYVYQLLFVLATGSYFIVTSNQALFTFIIAITTVIFLFVLRYKAYVYYKYFSFFIEHVNKNLETKNKLNIKYVDLTFIAIKNIFIISIIVNMLIDLFARQYEPLALTGIKVLLTVNILLFVILLLLLLRFNQQMTILDNMFIDAINMVYFDKD